MGFNAFPTIILTCISFSCAIFFIVIIDCLNLALKHEIAFNENNMTCVNRHEFNAKINDMKIYEATQYGKIMSSLLNSPLFLQDFKYEYACYPWFILNEIDNLHKSIESNTLSNCTNDVNDANN